MQEVRLPDQITGASVYAYVGGLYASGRDRFYQEVHGRGLSIGDLAVEDFFFGVMFRTSHEKPVEMSTAEIGAILSDIVEEHRLLGVTLDSTGVLMDDEATLVMTDDVPYKGVIQSRAKGVGRFVARRCFLQVTRSGGTLRMEAYGPESTEVALELTRRLGQKTAPVHFAYESPVALSMIVDHAFRWRDPDSGKCYVEVVYDPALVKHMTTTGGRTWDRKDVPSTFGATAPRKVMVLGGSDFPIVVINTLTVHTRELSEPTAYMQEARECFRAQSIRRCAHTDCGKLAVREVSGTRAQLCDMAIGTSRYVCADPAHLTEIRSTLKDLTNLTESQVTQESW